MEGLLGTLQNALQNQWQQGEPYRAAVGGLLSGDTQPLQGLLGAKTRMNPMTVDEAMTLAMDWGPMALGTLKPIKKAGKIAGIMDDAYKGKLEGPNYQISHKPMTVDGGAALLHDLEPAFGPDVYGPNAMQYFGSGGYDKQEKAILNLMRKVKGNPNAEVTIYRGVPDGVTQINPGDWITLHPELAAEYGNVLSLKVPARQVTSWPDSLAEFGWFPD